MNITQFNLASFKNTVIGRIPKEWEVVRLGRILSLRNGERPSASKNGIFPIYGANGIMGYASNFLVDNNFTIVIGRVGASGEVHLGTGKIWISDNAIYSENYNKNKVYMTFLYHLLKFKKISQFASKSTHPIITQSFLNSFLIPLPPLPEQQKIAEILSTVDSAIEKVNQAIEKTQRLKKGLMQELLTKGIGHNEFKDTEIGRIPKEWEVVKLEEIFDVQVGGDIYKLNFSKQKNERYKFPIYSNSLENNGLYGYADTYQYPENCITVTGRGTLGRATPRFEKFNAIIRLLVLIPKANINIMFVSEYINARIGFRVEKTSIPQLTAPKLAKYKLPLPPLPEQQKIAEILSTVDKRLELLRAKKEKLERIKKGLMHDLLTGRRRVC